MEAGDEGVRDTARRRRAPGARMVPLGGGRDEDHHQRGTLHWRGAFPPAQVFRPPPPYQDPRRPQDGLRDTVLSAVGARLLDLSVDPTGVHVLGVDPRALRPERVLGGGPLRAADDPDGLLPAYLDQRLLGSLTHRGGEIARGLLFLQGGEAVAGKRCLFGLREVLEEILEAGLGEARLLEFEEGQRPLVERGRALFPPRVVS